MLADILSPMSLDEFLSDYWSKQFLHLPGPSNKFERLFSWDVLNRALEEHRFAPDRLRLVKGDQPTPSSQYLTGDEVDAERLVEHLSAGATLIFNFCDRVHQPLRELCVQLERLFHVRVKTNLYAGWRRDNGFNIHWDPHNAWILQVSGRKRWLIWQPTRLHPFNDDVVDTSPATKPDTPPIWEGVLEPGGMLSIPRGWWHVAYPLDEPCLHLTIGFESLTGLDLFAWLAHQLKASDAFRQDLPLAASRDTQQAWLASVMSALHAAWTDDLLDRYVADTDAKAKARPRLALPNVSSTFFCDDSTPLELALPRPLLFSSDNSQSRFAAAGVEWTTTSELAALLARLNDGQPHTLSELSPDSDARLRMLVMELLMRRVVRAVPRSRL